MIYLLSFFKNILTVKDANSDCKHVKHRENKVLKHPHENRPGQRGFNGK